MHNYARSCICADINLSEYRSSFFASTKFSQFLKSLPNFVSVVQQKMWRIAMAGRCVFLFM